MLEWPSDDANNRPWGGEPKGRVVAVDLLARGAAFEKSEVAQNLVLDPLEHEGRPWMAAGVPPTIGNRGVEPLGNEPDAHQLVRRTMVAPPQAAVLPGEAVVVGADLGLVGAGAVLGPAHFQAAGLFRVPGGAPVKAVAAQVHESAAAAQPAVYPIQHAEAVILRVAAGDHDMVRRQ